MKNRYLKLGAVCMMVGLVMVTSGCSSKKISKGDESPGTPPPTTLQPPVGEVESLDTQPMTSQSTFAISEGRTTGPMLPIYFDFDQNVIRDDQKSRMETNANYLKSHPKALVTIEGNCDNRGTNEYNIALGDRRAGSAKKYLAAMGVDVSNLSTISYGEERPLNPGQDELALSQNRRDDFVQR